jgi:hypothetical protein
MSTIDVTVQVIDDIDTISINVIDAIQSISVSEAAPQITSIEMETGINSLVYAVNGLQGNVVLTYRENLGSVSSSAGVYSYQILHGLNSSSPIIAVYNVSNEQVFCDVETNGSNSIYLRSLVDMNGYRVVIQR